MIIKDQVRLTYDDVLLEPQFSATDSRADGQIHTDIAGIDFQLPIISSNMDTITGPTMARKMATLGGLGVIHRYMSVAQQIKIMKHWDTNHVLSLSVGTLKNDRERIDATVEFFQKFSSLKDDQFILCVDIAHGHSQHMLDALRYIRQEKGFTGRIMAGAVCTPKATLELLEAGADIVRTGVGPGGGCDTRGKTGCGYPQLSAVIECAKVGPVVADGGIRTPGDAAKALAAGAKAIMVGNMLKGTDCVPGWLPDAPHMRYQGMASKAAREGFGQPGINAEGISMDVPTRPAGSTEAVITNLTEGIRSAMSYIGAHDLDEFFDRAVFVRGTPLLVQENIPHARNSVV